MCGKVKVPFGILFRPSVGSFNSMVPLIRVVAIQLEFIIFCAFGLSFVKMPSSTISSIIGIEFPSEWSSEVGYQKSGAGKQFECLPGWIADEPLPPVGILLFRQSLDTSRL